MKKLIAGNWKMNGSRSEARALIADIVNALHEQESILEAAELLVCPPALYISDVRHALQGFPKIIVGAQDAVAHENGAHTGDLSAEMLKGAGCSYVIVGHSERRANHAETDAQVAQKAKAVLAQDMIPIICVGESESEREEGRAEEIVAQQMEGSIPKLEQFQQIVMAYEPVWAIGTGKTATPDDVTAMHAFIREKLKTLVPDVAKTPVLYGGSMKPDNASALLACPNVDGGLIGGASLSAESFLAIAGAA